MAKTIGMVPVTAVWPETPSELPESAAWLVRQNPEVIVAPARASSDGEIVGPGELGDLGIDDQH